MQRRKTLVGQRVAAPQNTRGAKGCSAAKHSWGKGLQGQARGAVRGPSGMDRGPDDVRGPVGWTADRTTSEARWDGPRTGRRSDGQSEGSPLPSPSASALRQLFAVVGSTRLLEQSLGYLSRAVEGFGRGVGTLLPPWYPGMGYAHAQGYPTHAQGVHPIPRGILPLLLCTRPAPASLGVRTSPLQLTLVRMPTCVV